MHTAEAAAAPTAAPAAPGTFWYFFSKCSDPSSSDRAIYSNSAESFKRRKNREDSSDLDENLTESIAATQTFI